MLDRIKGWFAHSRTIFAARLYAIAGGLLTLHDIAGPYVMGADWAPISAKVPPFAWLMIVIGTGALFEWLRRVTTQPLADKMPADKVPA